ncbi:unnamed protein product [Leptosia nina]|uniref:Uncharacterized protein n=1 Tax=Leptosia nina TaxID=320188 RepID=A0AAV1K5N1_9NEOP
MSRIFQWDMGQIHLQVKILCIICKGWDPSCWSTVSTTPLSTVPFVPTEISSPTQTTKTTAPAVTEATEAPP